MNIILQSITLIISLLISIAYLTLSERKIMSFMQRRIGPNRVGYKGIIQPIIDGVKLLFKEIIIPYKSHSIEILIGPLFILFLVLIVWIPFPFNLRSYIYDLNYGLLFIFAISSLNVYLFIFSGWFSFSKFAFLSSLRSISQLISYEVSFGLLLLSFFLLNHNFLLSHLFLSNLFIPFFFPLFPIFSLFLISILAETNRPPFDLAEAESELIAGYLIEYGGFAFAAIYLAEYGFILFLSFFTSLLFFSIFIPFFASLFIFFFIWIRASLPRIRFDQLMNLGWLNILPFSISYFLFSSSLFFLFL